MDAAPDAISVNPKSAAMIAIMKKINAQNNMLHLVFFSL